MRRLLLVLLVGKVAMSMQHPSLPTTGTPSIAFENTYLDRLPYELIREIITPCLMYQVKKAFAGVYMSGMSPNADRKNISGAVYGTVAPNQRIRIARYFPHQVRVSSNKGNLFFCADDTLLVSLVTCFDRGIVELQVNSCDVQLPESITLNNQLKKRICKIGEFFDAVKISDTTNASESTAGILLAYKKFDTKCYKLLIDKFSLDFRNKTVAVEELYQDSIDNDCALKSLVLAYNAHYRHFVVGTERYDAPAQLLVIDEKKKVHRIATYNNPCESFRKLYCLKDGRTLSVQARGIVSLWDFEDVGQPKRTELFEGIMPSKIEWDIYPAGSDLSSDEKKLVIGLFSGQLFLVDLVEKTTRALSSSPRGAIKAVRFFPDNQKIVCSRMAQGSGDVEIWDTESNMLLVRAFRPAHALTISKNGDFIVLENTIWDISFLKKLEPLSAEQLAQLTLWIKTRTEKNEGTLHNQDKLDFLATVLTLS